MIGNRNIGVLMVGSLNHDIVANMTNRPNPGETVLAHHVEEHHGGKGGNQAAAAARAGADVVMVGAVGRDAAGSSQVEDLERCGVSMDRVEHSSTRATSMALITVTGDGENAIVVTPGANDLVDADMVCRQAAGLSPKVVMAQSEIGTSGCEGAADVALRTSARFIFSNGPVIEMSAALAQACDPLIVNEHEALDILRRAGKSLAPGIAIEDLAKSVCDELGTRSVVVTLGQRGSVVGPVAGRFRIVPAMKVERVVDTTGAGDTYAGTVAAELARQNDLLASCEAGSLAAAQSVAWVGARPSVGVLK